MNTNLPKPGEKLYDPAYYDENYYGKGGRGGFKDYRFGSEEQEKQLGIKWHQCSKLPHKSVLFVGCALGFEVGYWRLRGKRAYGIDVSSYAIAHQIPEAAGSCILYDGRKIPGEANFDLVACFDVLPHLPADMQEELIGEMVRVAEYGIAWRTIVKNWRNLDVAIDGQDGAWFRYSRFEEMDRLFTRSGKFKLQWLEMHAQYEVSAVYARA